MIQDVPQISNQNYHPYICPKCKENAKLLNINITLGTITFQCNCSKDIVYDIDDYLLLLEQEGRINVDDYDNQTLDDNSSKIELVKETQDLSDVIRANQLISRTQEMHPNNYYHIKSLLNLGKYIEKRNKTPSDIYNTIDIIIANNQDNENKAIKTLEGYSIYINNKVENLSLKGEKVEKKYRWLGDDGFKALSEIRFKHLIELNVSSNGIASVEPLNNMLLPHLKYLNLSTNLIIDITPVAKLLSEHLNEILLQDNQIDDIGPFKDSNFNELEILRVDKNNINFKSQKFIEVQKKYGKKLIYQSIKFEEFNKKYECDLNEGLKDLELGSKHSGDIILNDLYRLYNSPISIIYLILDDNKLQNVSILSRMSFCKLQILDLSLNLITNLKFLKKLSKKSKSLQKLYLDDNKISDISPLINYSDENDMGEKIFKELTILTLKNNKFYNKNKDKEGSLTFKNKETLDIVDFLFNDLKDGFDFYEDEIKLAKENYEKNNRGTADINQDYNTNINNNNN